MQYLWKVFLYENGQKGTEYTNNLTLPIFIEDRLDETLDTGEIVLKNMPIDTKFSFPPKTKFRLERYVDISRQVGQDRQWRLSRYWDYVVEHDDVQEYTGLKNICTHRISLIEASVVAQGMHCDNIALTYELNDVDLNYKVVKPPEGSVTVNITNDIRSNANHKDLATCITDLGPVLNTTGDFIGSYKYEWDNNSIESGMKKLLMFHHAGNSNIIEFDVPKLEIFGCYFEGSWTKLFELNTVTRVKKVLKHKGQIVSPSGYITLSNGSTEFKSGAYESFDTKNDGVYQSDGTNAYLRDIYTGYHLIDTANNINEAAGSPPINLVSGAGNTSNFSKIYKSFPQLAKSNVSYKNKTISFKTDALSIGELDDDFTIDYEIECVPDPTYRNGMLSYLKIGYQFYIVDMSSLTGDLYMNVYSSYISPTPTMALTTIAVTTTIYCHDMANGKNTPFLKKGVSYNCYDLVRKAMLSLDTQLLDNSTTCLDEWGYSREPSETDAGQQDVVPSIDYPIVLDPLWMNRLKVATMQETIFEGKNLWEVLIQVGYYLHAIPYLEFAPPITNLDGTTNLQDKFVLKFKQLGDTKTKADTSLKKTIFNSTNINEYFSQYDAYVTNLFSPQNEVEEYLTCKTSDSSYLVSNDTSELQTKYGITEVVEFDIIYNGERKDALQYIFEQSIYQALSNGDPSQISPAKGNSIYYSLSDNKIQGLSYVAPSVNNDKLMSLKYIMQKLFGIKESVWTQNFTFNNLRFRIKYKTQDSARVTQFRPDLEKFMKSSTHEKYPHHEQFYGQQDKIVDSERFSANLYGKLIRVANNVIQCQEYARLGEEKETGDLVTISNSAYYVTAIDNEYYSDAILQKVTYTKNFNQLSNITTIPSEPRFYEVSERSKTRREVRIQEFFKLSTIDSDKVVNAKFISSTKWNAFITNLLFKKQRTLPNYAYTKFMADHKRIHKVLSNELFPSSDFRRTGDNTIEPLGSADNSECIVPILHFPLHDGIVFEWDMDDNFKVGDMIDNKIKGAEKNNLVDGSYLSQQSVRYCDVFGRADLFRFDLFYSSNFTDEQIQSLPRAYTVDNNDNHIQIFNPSNSMIGIQGSAKMAIALDKDNREELSFNYQINLLHNEPENDFITFPNLFGQKDSDLKVHLLNQKISLFDENVDITAVTILADVTYTITKSPNNSIQINFNNPQYIADADITQVQSIVFYQQNENYTKSAIISKNLNPDDHQKLQPWYIYPVYSE